MIHQSLPEPTIRHDYCANCGEDLGRAEYYGDSAEPVYCSELCATAAEEGEEKR